MLAILLCVRGAPSQTMETARQGAVATDQLLASATGISILRKGGSAVDAAIAIAYTLAVTYPAAGNIGGGGFMLVRFANGKSHFIDFRETAPAAARADMYLDAQGNVVPGRSTLGALSAGVPGTVAGLEYARAHYATLSRKDLMADAIEYATAGFTLSESDAAMIAGARERLGKFASTSAIFSPDGATPKAGTLFRQPDLARTLRHIDADGADGFYRGDVAHEIASSIQAAGGIITEADLAAYRVVDRAPVSCRYRGNTVVTAPLPSSGGVAMCEIFGMLAADVPRAPVRSFQNAHLLLEAERRAFRDRNTQLGDPAFVKSRVSALLDPTYLKQQRGTIDPERATPSNALALSDAHEGSNTTSFSVVDAAGNAVNVSYTLNDSFGSALVAGMSGVLLNDEMDDFTSKPGVPNIYGLVQGTANAIAPGKRPLSSMSPTVVVAPSGKALLVVGAAGGPRIISTVLDSIRAVVDFGEDATTALQDPRVHMQWLPDVVYADAAAFDDATAARLRSAGYTLKLAPVSSVANAILVTTDGRRLPAHDPRKPGGAALWY
ncbi:MAG: gamma-glutamyltransferase [Candidatus Eremiobacteraeota bacterium]|nr:gamma-glutamyltransferase [Candidatus Eremiobacteraeota bacterium]